MEPEEKQISVRSEEVALWSNTAQTIFSEMVTYFKRHSNLGLSEKTGGVLCVMDKETGVTVATFLVGSAPKNKLQRYIFLAQVKAERLYKHLPHHLTSYESRDPKQDHWSGAIVGSYYIFSFSGFSEDTDSFASLAVASQTGNIERGQAEKIIKLAAIVRLTRIPEFEKLL